MGRFLYSNLIFYFLPLLSLNAQVQRCSTIELEKNKVLVHVNVDGVSRKMRISFCDFSSINACEGESPSGDVKVSSDFLGEILLRPAKNTPINICADESIGLIGLDQFHRNSNTTHLDFDEMQLCALSEQESYSLLGQGYREVKSIFYRDKIEIVLSINWQDYKFTFDVNYDGTFSHPAVETLKLSKEYKINYDEISLTSINVNQVVTIFPFTKVYMNKLGYSAALTLNSNTNSRVGLGFLKGFNWIIDYKKKKLFCKKNSIAIDSNIMANDNKSSIIGNEILIVRVKHNSRKYLLRAVITSVSGIMVSTNTICELQNILESSSNWDDLQLTFRP